jgi:hypothetical protein
MSKTTTLGESQLTQSPNETITVELVQPDDMPPIVKIGWPLQPTVIDPERFRDVAAAMVRLFSDAHVALARIRAAKYL